MKNMLGRDAWMFRWHLLNEKSPISPDDNISREVVAILKKEFHHYRFLCNVKMKEGDAYPGRPPKIPHLWPLENPPPKEVQNVVF